VAVAAHLLEAIELGLREPVAFEEASVTEKESGIGRQHQRRRPAFAKVVRLSNEEVFAGP
jgi:hypothetical protein